MADRGRVLCWFSCGDASAVACALALKQYAGREIVVARIVIPSEHEDNDRFANECERWFGQPIVNLRSDEYADTWDVWEKRRYIAGIKGAPCTAHLKKAVRYAFQRPDDLHVFGYTNDARDVKRATELREANFELSIATPLIDARLCKPDCHALVRAQGIEIPAMYRLGYDNNNCIGCPKGGAGYWNMIRRDFPTEFNRMVELSRRLGARIVKVKEQRIFLDELDPKVGKQKDEPEIDCSAHCEVALDFLGGGRG